MSQLETNYEIISDKTKNPVTSTEYIKHDDKWLNEAINSVETELAKKANKNYVDNELAKKANKDYVDNELAKKLDANAIDYVTPQMYGAKGDGNTDDYDAFNRAIKSKRPVIIPSGTYKIGSQLVFDENATNYFCGSSAGVNVTLRAPYGIKIKANNITMANFWLYGNSDVTPKVNNGITFAGDTNGTILSDILFAHYHCAISNVDGSLKGYAYGNKYERLRVYSCTNFIDFEDYGTGYTAYNHNFKDCWVLTAEKLGRLVHFRGVFNNCILYVNSDKMCMATGLFSEVKFDSCTFETDRLTPNDSSYIFYNDAIRLIFENCDFVENGNANCHWFVNVNASKIYIEKCKFSAYSTDRQFGTILNMTFSNSSQVGSIKISKSILYNDEILSLYETDNIIKPKFDFVDGIGIPITDGTQGLIKNTIYSKFDSTQKTKFIGKYLYDGENLIPISSTAN